MTCGYTVSCISGVPVSLYGETKNAPADKPTEPNTPYPFLSPDVVVVVVVDDEDDDDDDEDEDDDEKGFVP